MSADNKISKCDMCKTEITKGEWVLAGLLRGKLKCEKCGAKYRVKTENRIIASSIFVLPPALMIHDSVMKIMTMIILAIIVYSFCDKNWFVRD